MQIPANKRDIQVFLGMVGYYRRFIPDFAEIADPLFHFLRANVKFNFSEDCMKAFKQLTKLLATAPVLAYPNLSKNTLFKKMPLLLLLVQCYLRSTI